jgi:hypothetical protein
VLTEEAGMNWGTTALAAIMVGVLSPSLCAQWPLHAVGIPKRPDGKPDLTASTPRTPDGKPDLSGVWTIAGGVDTRGLPFQPWAADLQQKRAAENGLNDPDGLCLPQGPLQYHVDPQPLKIVQTPKQILIIYESNYGLRTIYMDGRALPKLGDPQPFWHGYSVGRWEGDALVVDSNNFRGVDPAEFKGAEPKSFFGVGWLDHRGSPYTTSMTLSERFRRVNYGQMDIEMTVDDPKAYTKPFTLRMTQRIVADGSEPIEFICHENQMFLKLTGRAPR